MGDSSSDTDDPKRPGSSQAMPRWVKMFGIVGVVVVLLVVIVLLLGGGPRGHGPGRHLPGGDASEVGTAGGPAVLSGVAAHG